MTVDPESVGLVHHARAWPEKPALVIGDLSRTYGQLRALSSPLSRLSVNSNTVLRDAVAKRRLLRTNGETHLISTPIPFGLRRPRFLGPSRSLS
jgi:hypothetical protein